MISVIVYGRNDSHGYNLAKRAALSFNCIAEVLTHPDDEIVFVDCNTPEDLPTFPEAIADTITDRAKKLLRILRLRPEQYDRGKNGAKFKVLEPLCRNVAIRRANPANRWILNTNTDMVFVPLVESLSLSDVAAALPDGFYELPRFEMPEVLWETTNRMDPRGVIQAFKRWGRRLHVNEMVAGKPEILFDGPGDFQLALRQQMLAIHGMNEAMVLGWHVDSNLCKRLFLLNGETRSLLDQVYAYHCDHTRLNTIYHSAGDSTQNDWRKFFNDVVSPYLPDQAKTWGLAGETIEEIQLTEEYQTRYERTLEKLLPGLAEPMLKNALVCESYNHGLLYDNQHVLPYLADHLTTVPPDAALGYLGGNVGLLRLLAGFRAGFGHRGLWLFDPELMRTAQAHGWETLPANCVPTEAGKIFDQTQVCCFDLSMITFPTQVNRWGYEVPRPSIEAGSHAAWMLRRFLDYVRQEKERLKAGVTLPHKFIFLGTQNTWFESAVTQLVSVVLTPYSSYVRHGMVRRDALEKPFQPVPGHELLIGHQMVERWRWVERAVGGPVRLADYLAAEVRCEMVKNGILPPSLAQTVLTKLKQTPVGRASMRLQADIGAVDGELDGAARLSQSLEEPESSARQHDVQATQKLRDRPTPRRSTDHDSMVIGIDIRTLCHADSAARGVGHYTRHHVEQLIRLRPQWQFILYAESGEPSPAVQPLLSRSNVSVRALASYQAGDIDLFHIPDPLCLKPGFVSPMSLMPEVPATVTFHDLAGLRIYLTSYPPLQQLEYVDRLDQLMNPRFRLLTNSEFTRRDMIQATGLPPERAITIWAGLNQEESASANTPASRKSVRAKYGIRRPFLLHVGALDPHKNFESVIQVLARLPNHDLELVVVGEKDHFLKQIADFVAEVKMPGIIFTGFIPRADLEALYREAVALVFLSCFEGFGFPVLEAMAHDCPVVASNATSLPEIAGDAALLFDPKDIPAISQGVERLLGNPALRRAQLEKGRQRAAQFSWEKTALKTIAVWEEMLPRPVGTPSEPISPGSAQSHAATVALAGNPVAATCPPADAPVVNPPFASRLGVVWLAPWQNPSGYCQEALAFVRGLGNTVPLELVDVAVTKSPAFVAGLPEPMRELLREKLKPVADVAGKIAIQHLPGSGFVATKTAAYDIGRTMFETDRLPLEWVTRCNLLDEIWVPSQFNADTFAASGVERDKIQVIPEAVDETLFDPAKTAPWPLTNPTGCNFLSVFEWSARKAWDTLLAAYLREFSAEDDVCLYLRAYLVDQPDQDPSEVLWPIIRQFAATLNLGDKSWPRLVILGGQIPTAELPRLYQAIHCLVAPSHGEGWGRPHHEAMMMGRPVIATRWSGNTEFMTEANSYLLDYELGNVGSVDAGFQHYRGHRWAYPSEKHLRELMRRVQQNPDEARAKGNLAREHVLRHFSLQPVARIVQQRLAAIETALTNPICPAVVARSFSPEPQAGNHPVPVAWEGSFLDYGSLSLVNRELTTVLSKTNPKLVCVGSASMAGSAAKDPGMREWSRRLRNQAPKETAVTVRHQWPPRWEAPPRGVWVLIQPWEFGALPAEWVSQLKRVDEVWVPSGYVRRVYVDSGVDPAKVKVVPNGIDPARFNPSAAPRDLPTKKSFKFLFVGGTIARKGPDVLLNTYIKAFTQQDDVCLVIKDFGGQDVYAGQTLEAQILAIQKQPGTPEIVYLRDDLQPAELPGLYTACDCLVHPYRGEGFGLPVLEGMACGLPVVVTAGGATDDFADDTHAYRIPALKKRFGATAGNLPLARAGWMLEPDATALAARMRWVFEHRDEARAKGRLASDYARREWTWENAARLVEQHLQRLAAPSAAVKSPAVESARKPAAIALPPCALISHLGPARECLRQKRLPEAWSATQAALATRPFHPEAYLLLAEIALAAGDSINARRCGQHAANMAPGFKPARQFLKGSLRGNGKPDWLAIPDTIQNPDANSSQRLSVCLIAKNEERFLGQCLASIKEIAHQIVVVDTGSTDRTVEIAKEHGAEVHAFAWCDDFSAARNAALAHVTGDWVLVLDADEELPADSRKAIRKEMENPKAMAYRLPIVDQGREDEGVSYVPRLFRNAPGLFFVGRVHEQVFSSLEVRRQEWGLENRLGESAILHYGYTAELNQARQKNARNLRLLQKAVDELPNEPSLLMNLGLELVRAGQFQAGLDQYELAYEALSAQPADQIVPELRESLLTQLTSNLLAAKQPQRLVAVLRSPLARQAPLTASMHFTLGLALMELKQFAEAIQAMRQCLACRQEPAYSPIHKEIRKAGPHHCLALCLNELKRYAEAEAAFQAALKADPQSRAARLDYARFQAGQGKMLEALRLIHDHVCAQANDQDAWLLGSRIALSQPEFMAFANDWTEESLRHFPEVPEMIAQRAEALLLDQKAETALPLWEQVWKPRGADGLAAWLWCELAVGHESKSAQCWKGDPTMEAAVSQSFVKWYQRLAKHRAMPLLDRVNQNVAALESVLPTATQWLRAASAEAGSLAVR